MDDVNAVEAAGILVGRTVLLAPEPLLETDTASRRSVATQDQARCPHCQAVLPTYRGDRRFTIIDAMVLVAASAVAFVIARPLVTGFSAGNRAGHASSCFSSRGS